MLFTDGSQGCVRLRKADARRLCHVTLPLEKQLHNHRLAVGLS